MADILDLAIQFGVSAGYGSGSTRDVTLALGYKPSYSRLSPRRAAASCCCVVSRSGTFRPRKLSVEARHRAGWFMRRTWGSCAARGEPGDHRLPPQVSLSIPLDKKYCAGMMRAMDQKTLSKKDYLAEFDGSLPRAAEFLGITRQAIQQWGDHVPRKHYIDLAHRSPRKWGYLIRR